VLKRLVMSQAAATVAQWLKRYDHRQLESAASEDLSLASAIDEWLVHNQHYLAMAREHKSSFGPHDIPEFVNLVIERSDQPYAGILSRHRDWVSRQLGYLFSKL
jgi:hypothetical protein